MSTPDANGWMPIDSAPKDGTRILAALGDKATTVRWVDGYWTIYHINERRWMRWLYGPQSWLVLLTAPTHWHPLPKPPVQATPPRNAS